MTPGQPDGVMRYLLQRHGLDSMEGVMAYRGGTDLAKPGLDDRRRTRLELADQSGERHVFYIKRYGPPGFLDEIRRWWRHGGALSPAEAEARNIQAARQAGVATMRDLDCRAGTEGSYLITTAVPGEALERCGEAFWRRLAADERAAAELAARLAELVRSLHAAGYVHRDLYASHVFLDERGGRFDLYLIDLARMFRPRWRRFRWRVKDLAALHYSLPPDWVAKWWEAFLRGYLGEVSAVVLGRWRSAVRRKSLRISRHAARRQAIAPPEARPE
jgi:tRNA A-37 threonylcarbamoyl transferase component Bud32